MVPCAEKLSMMVVSADEAVRDFLVDAAADSGWFGAIGHLARGDVASSILAQQICAWPRLNDTWFDVVITDQLLPGLAALRPMAKVHGVPFRPLTVRLLYSRLPACPATMCGAAFDLCVELPDSIASLTDVFRGLASQYLHGGVGFSFNPGQP